MKTLALIFASLLIGMIAGAALANSLASDDPLAPCNTLEQRANARIDAMEYAIEGSNPVEALERAKRDNCK
jgi:hypothetical protein